MLPVVHLELHTADLQRARDFYAELCGWKPEMVRSYQALDVGSPVLGGGIVETPTPRPLWLPYVEVPEIHFASERARELGGAVLLEPRESPNGWRAVIRTPCGGELALWQHKR